MLLTIQKVPLWLSRSSEYEYPRLFYDFQAVSTSVAVTVTGLNRSGGNIYFYIDIVLF